MQTQYASRYHGSQGAAPDLSQGLRITEWDSSHDYHALQIHPDDVAEMARRIAESKAEIGACPPGYVAEVEERIKEAGY